MTNASTHPSIPLVTPEAFRQTVVRMLRPRGGRRPWPKKQRDRWILLHCASRRLAAGEALSEKEANARLQNWLLGPGDRLDFDFVTLRRALIDEGFWDRDPGGTRYRLANRHERRIRFAEGLPDEAELLAAEDAEVEARGARGAEPADGGPAPA